MMLINEQLGIFHIRLPLPLRLNHINSYAIKGRDGWWLIDPGINIEESRQVWRHFMAKHNIAGHEIRGIYLTHAHFDHFGAAGWLQQQFGSPVYLHAAEADVVKNVWQGFARWSRQEIVDDYYKNGMPPDLIADVADATAERFGLLVSFTRPIPELSILEMGRPVQLGDCQYQLLLTRGHSKGHICFFNEQYGVLFSGDHLLTNIATNISFMPGGDPNPIKSFLGSLNSISHLVCHHVLPGHGKPFSDFKGNITWVAAHHHQRISMIKDFAAGGATAYQIYKKVYGQSKDLIELRFSICETLAYLMFLVEKGEIKVIENDGINVFDRS